VTVIALSGRRQDSCRAPLYRPRVVTAVAAAPQRPDLRAPGSSVPWAVAVSVVALVAFVARLLPRLRGGGLGGIDGYDDSVYYAAATALVHGREPYADFVLLHPSGLILALTPFAAFARLTPDSVGRRARGWAFMLLGAGNTVLVMRIARRFGGFAGVLAGLGYALSYPALYAERSTTLGTGLVRTSGRPAVASWGASVAGADC